MDDVEDEECGKSDSGGRIPESLCYDNSESRYSPPGSPPNASPRSTPLSNEDDDREDPDSEGITGQGATQEPAGQESVEREIELHGLQAISNLQQDGGSHNRQRVIASGHVCKELAGRRSPDRDQPDLNRLGPLRPASNSTGEPQNADPNRVVGPSTMKSPSASAVRPGRRRRYPPPTHQGPDEGEVGAPAGASPGPPSHAGSRATRNPAPAYCAPPQRKRKAAGRGDGEAPGRGGSDAIDSRAGEVMRTYLISAPSLVMVPPVRRCILYGTGRVRSRRVGSCAQPDLRGRGLIVMLSSVRST
jgi:hypothetical protein